MRLGAARWPVVPAVAGWQFYKHRGLMDIRGSVPGYSAFLSRFTDAKELVCVTLMANKEGIDFTNLGRRIAGAFEDLLSTNSMIIKLYLFEGQLPAEGRVERLEKELTGRGIPVLQKSDHAQNSKDAGLELRPTTVLVFGSPKVGRVSCRRIRVFHWNCLSGFPSGRDEAGSTWLAFPKFHGWRRSMAWKRILS